MGSWADYNQTEAFKSLNSFSNMNYSFNVSNYPAITQMTNSSAADNATSAANSIFTPITYYWVGTWGSWFYVLLIIFTVGTIYIKSQSVHRTSIALLFMSLLAVVPGTAGALYIPSVALYTLYILTGFALLGVLYSFWVGE
jgi:hypothetical protein